VPPELLGDQRGTHRNGCHCSRLIGHSSLVRVAHQQRSMSVSEPAIDVELAVPIVAKYPAVIEELMCKP
jgi:hypothetical protein